MTQRHYISSTLRLWLVLAAMFAVVKAQDLSAEPLSLLLLDSQEIGIAGQQVELLDSNGNSTERQTITDANGLAVFEVETNVRYRMRVYHNGGSYRTNRARAGDLVEVETARSVLRLRASSNGGIAGQRVELLISNSAPTGVEGVTDASGVAGFEILPGYRHRFRVHHNGGDYVSARVTYGRDITVRTRSSLLRLRDSGNAGIADQQVELLLADRTPTGFAGATDGSGVAAFEILPNYRHRFRVHHNGGNYTTNRLTYGRDATVRTRSSLLRLIASNNVGIGNQQVELLLADGTPTGFVGATDNAGRLAFEILPAYAHRYLVHHNGGTYTSEELGYGDDAQVQTQLSELHLVDSGGSGIIGQRVELLLANGTPTGFAGTTDAAGRLAFEILPVYAHRYLLHHNGGMYSTQELVYGEDAQVQTQRSELTLLNVVEQPVAGAQVELVRQDGSATGRIVLTTADGRGGFEILPDYAHFFAIHFEDETHLSEELVYGQDTVFILPTAELYVFMRRTTALYNTELRLPVLARGNVDQSIFAAETFIAYDHNTRQN